MSKVGSSDSKNTLYCSFCGKSQHELSKLIAGPINANVCLALCVPSSATRSTDGQLSTFGGDYSSLIRRNRLRSTDHSPNWCFHCEIHWDGVFGAREQLVRAISFDVCCAVLGRLILPRMQDVRLHLPCERPHAEHDFRLRSRGSPDPPIPCHPESHHDYARGGILTISSWNVCRDAELSTHVGLCD